MAKINLGKTYWTILVKHRKAGETEKQAKARKAVGVRLKTLGYANVRFKSLRIANVHHANLPTSVRRGSLVSECADWHF